MAGEQVMVIGLDCAPPEHVFDEYADDLGRFVDYRGAQTDRTAALRDLRGSYTESFAGFAFPAFDGTWVTIA